jgi:hypothetical protein
MAPLRETADLYPPSPQDKDWDKYPEMGNIEEEMHYLKGLGKKEWPSVSSSHSHPPRQHELWLLFLVMFDMNGNNTYNGLDTNLIKDFKNFCATYGPASPFCREYLAGWSNDTG